MCEISELESLSLVQKCSMTEAAKILQEQILVTSTSASITSCQIRILQCGFLLVVECHKPDDVDLGRLENDKNVKRKN